MKINNDMVEEIIFGIFILIITCCSYGMGYCRGKLIGYKDYERFYSFLENQLNTWIDYYKNLASLRLNILLENKVEISEKWRNEEDRILKEAEERNKEKDI